MTRIEKAAEVARLRAEGWTGTRIAKHMGLSTSYTYALIHDPDGSKDSKRKREKYGGACEECGTRTSYAKNAPARFCPEHAHLHPNVQAHAAAQREATARRTRTIERLWAEGYTLKQIAAVFGWSMGHVAVEFHRARANGADLPYRYRTGKRAGWKFERLAA